ncbi:MAG: hypothetical protein DCC75_13110 [Proteobacteria bacterium]|nr:MAG: hypothetical protein DCC75_13110 [Pseudomonadota bacterium]
MKKFLIAACTIAGILPAGTLLAESGPLGWGERAFKQEMETDRPDFTEGTQTMQPGHLQVESGYTYTSDDDGGDLDEHVLPELLLRIGVIDDLEFRLAWEGYISSKVDGHTDDGLSDFSVGFKHRMYQQAGHIPDFSFIGELSLPAGSSELSSDEVVPEVKFLWGYGFERFDLAGNLNFSGPIGEEGRYFEVANSETIGFDLTESIGAYIEYFGIYPAEDAIETTEHYLNGGFTYAATDSLQLDLRAGFGMNDAAADFFTGVGLALRI